MAKGTKGKEIAKWDEELAKYADSAASMEANVGGGQFFSLRGGTLSWQDSPLPDNQMAVIILDSILENVFYDGVYDPNIPQSPSCFAFGREEKELAPHSIVIEAGANQCDNCGDCPMNEWGTAAVGRGKACRNTRRLAMIPAGTFNQNGKLEMFDDEDHFASTAIGFMKLPVTSVKGYASFVKQVAGALRRPPFGIITKVKVVDDDKSQFKVVFEPLTTVPDELMATIMQRYEEAKSTIDFPYTPNDDEPAPPTRNNRSRAIPKPSGRGAAQKPAQKPAGRRKY